MLPTATLPALMTGPAPIETALPNGPQAAEKGDFKTILANNAAAKTVPLDKLRDRAADPETTTAEDAELPESGKDLPEAAEPGSTAVPAVTILPLLPLLTATASPAAPVQPDVDHSQPAAVPTMNLMPDQLLPRVAPGQAMIEPSQPAPLPLPQMPPMAAASLPAVALLPDGPRQSPPPRVAATLRLLAEATADSAVSAAPELPVTATPQTLPNQTLAFGSVPVVVPANAPSTAPAVMPVGHDFAQLIDRLVAARESTQPQAATLALAHADFGRVELRFASDAGNLSVAMASADPDFARAVQAAAPPVLASSDSHAAQGRQHGQPGAQAESFAGQQQGRHAARREPQAGRAATNSAPRKADSGRAAGIFA